VEAPFPRIDREALVLTLVPGGLQNPADAVEMWGVEVELSLVEPGALADREDVERGLTIRSGGIR
jgi:hypothetical protein